MPLQQHSIDLFQSLINEIKVVEAEVISINSQLFNFKSLEKGGEKGSIFLSVGNAPSFICGTVSENDFDSIHRNTQCLS